MQQVTQLLRGRFGWAIISGTIAGVLLFCCAGTLLLSELGASATPTATPAPHAQVHKPKPTATSKPTPKPVATPTITQRLTRIADNTAASDTASHVHVTFVKGVVTVTLQEGDQLDYSGAVTDLKLIVFDQMKALFTSQINIGEVDVIVNGSLVDQYGKTSIGEYGEADLTLATARKFAWDNLDQDTAWNDYDLQLVTVQQ